MRFFRALIIWYPNSVIDVSVELTMLAYQGLCYKHQELNSISKSLIIMNVKMNWIGKSNDKKGDLLAHYLVRIKKMRVYGNQPRRFEISLKIH